MNEKCNKYETFFTFASENDYKQHILECKDCQEQLNKEKKLSFLIKDSADTYKTLIKRKRKQSLVKAACALLLFVSVGTFAGFEYTEHAKYQKFMSSTGETSSIYMDGLPVDEYGFFDYE